MSSGNQPTNKSVRLSAIAGLILFTFPFAKQAISAQVEAHTGQVNNQGDFTYTGASNIALLSDGVGAEVNVTGTGTFNFANQSQAGFQVLNGGHINLSGGGSINEVDPANSSGGYNMAWINGANSQLTINNYQISVDSSAASVGRTMFYLNNSTGANTISNSNIDYKGNQGNTKLPIFDVGSSNLILINNHVVTENSGGVIVTTGASNINVEIDGGYYESTNSTDTMFSTPFAGATFDLGGNSTTNLKNNVQVIATDRNAIHLRYGTLNAQDATIQGGTAGILAAVSTGNVNLDHTDVSATQGSAVLANAYNYGAYGLSPTINLNAVNSTLSGNHGVRVEANGLITGLLDNTQIDAVDTSISADHMNAATGSGSIILTAKNGSVLNAANVFDAQNGGSLDITLNSSMATGSNHLIYSKDGSVSLNATASTLTGNMVQTGTGAVDVTLSDATNFKGTTSNINQLSLESGAVWEMSNDSSVTTLNNSGGTILFATPDNAFHTLNVAGNYSGGGTLVLNTILGDDASLTDKLVIAGDTSGSTKVKINNIGGAGAQTINGIEVIEVQGASNGTFTQDGRIVAGAYDYFLGRGDASVGTNAKSWYLSSGLTPSGGPTPDVVRPEAGSYLGLIEHNQGTFNHSFHDRQQLLDNEYQSAWARVEYTKSESKAGNGQLDNDTGRTLLHFGADLIDQDNLHLGLMGAYARGDVDTSSNLSGNTSSAKSDGYSAGVYATWFDQEKDKGGPYFDTYVQYNWFDNKVNGQGLAEESFNSNGYTLSAETGYGFILGKSGKMTWQVEPQVQFLYNSYDGKDHIEQNGTRVSTNDSDDFVSRVGVRFQGKSESFEPFVTLNYWNHSQNAGISMNETQVESQRARDIFEVKAGGQVHLNKNIDLFAQVSNSWGTHSTSSYGGNVGIKMKW